MSVGKRLAVGSSMGVVAFLLVLGLYPMAIASASSPSSSGIATRAIPETSGTHCSSGGNICIDVYGSGLNVTYAEIWTRNHRAFENGIVVMAVFPPGANTNSNNSEYWWWDQALDNYGGSGPNSFYINFYTSFQNGTRICGFNIGGDAGRPCITVS
jgi:hypothetical protein